MEKSAIYHISEHSYAYPVNNDTLIVRLKTKKNDVDKIVIHYKNLYDHSSNSKKAVMSKVLSARYCDLFEASLHIQERRFKYCFQIFSKGENIFFTSEGFMKAPADEDFFYYPCINEDDIFHLPKWAQGEVIYQVFVDRFFRSDRAPDYPDLRSWNMLPEKEMLNCGGFRGLVRKDTYYGGDLAGVTEKLDYISNLGAKVLYLNPIFAAESYHKYDVTDYFRIDSRFGTLHDLKELVEEAHARGMKVVLDGVFNHCSYANELFQDVVRNQEKSKYKDWFHIRSFPVNEERKDYDSFGNVAPSMPRLNTSNQEVIDYVIDLTTYWTKTLNLDGWRFDVADEVSHELWVQLRRSLKKISPEIILIGEVWNNASRWLQGNEMDTVTNYKFRKALLKFMQKHRNANIFWEALSSNNMLYKSPVYNYLINLVGSHDTTRCRTLLGSAELHVLAMVVTLSFQGMPLIYYGDELAIEGGFDPDNRRPMQWNEISNPWAKIIGQITRFRSESEILKKGSLVPFDSGNPEVISFTREYEGKRIHLVANFGDSNARVVIPGGVNEIILGQAEDHDSGTLEVGFRKFALISS
ncbi:MAG TPA: alpha-glycosidase [Kosmotogaceae bacterium]|nr:alpha-glycosidase [Kosmotogaceae bacterium]